jgi:hypothetical protein
MLPRLALLYRRYATQHLRLVLGELSIASGRSIPVVLRQGRICVVRDRSVCVARDGRSLDGADDVLLEQDGARSEGAAPSRPVRRYGFRCETQGVILSPSPPRPTRVGLRRISRSGRACCAASSIPCLSSRISAIRICAPVPRRASG